MGGGGLCADPRGTAQFLTRWPLVATFWRMNLSPPANTFSIRDARDRLTELARRVENGETIHVTRHGAPLFDMVPAKRGRLDLEAGERYLKSIGVEKMFPYVADDFDDPLPEDFLVRPLP
jgi:prevent-host-death family protein